jgi:uncharacterized protein YegJ (DUF2314 family)
MKRIVSAISLLAIVFALAWHFGLHQQLLERLRPHGVAQVTPEANSPVRKSTPAPVEGFTENAAFQLALYYLPRPTQPPLSALERLLLRFPNLHLERKGEAAGKASVRIADFTVDKYAPPVVDSLRTCAHGLTKEQEESLQKTEEVFVLDFRYRPAEGFAVLHEAYELLLALARETGGLLWDEETREVFTPEAWQERRLDLWKGPLPDAPSHFTIHLYRSGELLRAISLGMGKLGLPDLVVEELPAGSSSSVGNLINLTAQTLLEKGRLDSPGCLRLDVATLKNERLQKDISASYLDGATGRRPRVRPRNQGGGRSEQPSLEIDFPPESGPSRPRPRRGSHHSPVRLGGRDHLREPRHRGLEASRKAKREFPRLAALARKGFAPGERLLLKAPFETDADGREWMWVEVVTWKGDVVNGILQNDPYEVSGLAAGARVEFRSSDAFDYIHYLPDGSELGNGTGAILRRREEGKK